MDVVKEIAKQLKQLDVKNVLVEGEFISATQFEALKAVSYTHLVS